MDRIEWKYRGKPDTGRDCRHLVTLMENGMVWVGIRAYDHVNNRWLNGGEPERNRVLAFAELPEPASGRWIHGELICVELAKEGEDDH